MNLITILSICLIGFLILGFYYKKIGAIGMLITVAAIISIADWTLLFNIGLGIMYIPTLSFIFPSLKPYMERKYLKLDIGLWIILLGLCICVYSYM